MFSEFLLQKWFSLEPWLGWLVFAILICAPLILWRVVLADRFKPVGVLPYFAGYLATAIGLALVCLTMVSVAGYMLSIQPNSPLAADGVLSQWIIGMARYAYIITGMHLVIALGLIGVPTAAYMLKTNRASTRNILILTAIVFVVLAIGSFFTPQMSDAKSIAVNLFGLLLYSIVVCGAFYFTIFRTARYLERRKTLMAPHQPASA